ncbi:hypothetical protein ND748_14770 [Frankia sp. AiPs1]|uniref:hypothetical protein n=1 Tax=Frankia sp. AiPs1 TaxID=573493 RepID=UPI002043B401|nr:hypothetical protein [Frankia sp. AiPs1]MCM3922919.1 hypothetical protein [Frankia sp. AiPs1]
MRRSPVIRRLGVGVTRFIESGPANSGMPPAGASVHATILDAALRRAGLDAVVLNRQVEDDGTVILLASGLDEPQTIADLLRLLRRYTTRTNRMRPAGGRIRLRVAFDEGLASLVEERFVGDVVDALRRLCTGAARLPVEALDVDLVALVSERIYRGVIETDRWELRSSAFREVRVTGADGSALAAWMWLPPPDPPPDPAREPA